MKNFADSVGVVLGRQIHVARSMRAVADVDVYMYELGIESQVVRLFHAVLAAGAVFQGAPGQQAQNDRWFSLTGFAITVQGSTPTGGVVRYVVDFTQAGVAEVEKIPVMSVEVGLLVYNYLMLDTRNYQDFQRALQAVKSGFGGTANNSVAMVVAASELVN